MHIRYDNIPTSLSKNLSSSALYNPKFLRRATVIAIEAEYIGQISTNLAVSSEDFQIPSPETRLRERLPVRRVPDDLILPEVRRLPDSATEEEARRFFYELSRGELQRTAGLTNVIESIGENHRPLAIRVFKDFPRLAPALAKNFWIGGDREFILENLGSPNFQTIALSKGWLEDRATLTNLLKKADQIPISPELLNKAIELEVDGAKLYSTIRFYHFLGPSSHGYRRFPEHDKRARELCIAPYSKHWQNGQKDKKLSMTFFNTARGWCHSGETRRQGDSPGSVGMVSHGLTRD